MNNFNWANYNNNISLFKKLSKFNKKNKFKLPHIGWNEILINKDSSTGFLSKKLENLNRKYVLLLEKLLFRPKLTAITVILLLVLSGVIFKIVGVTLFPPADKPILLVDIELPEGGAIEETFIEARAAVKKVQKAYPNATYALNIGHGNPKLYYNIFPKTKLL